MARIVTYGAETQQVPTTTGGVIEGEGLKLGGGSPVVDTTIKRSGAASMKLPTVAATCWIEWDITGALNTDYRARIWFYMSAAATAAQAIYEARTSGGLLICRVQIEADSTLRVYNQAATAIGNASSTPSTGAWHVLEVHFNVNSAGGAASTAEALLDGVSFCNTTTANLASTAPAQHRVGRGTSTAPGYDLYVDDIAINDSTGSSETGWPNRGAKVAFALPASDPGTSSANWTKPGGSTLNRNTSVDNVPPVGIADSTASGDAEKQLRDAASSATDDLILLTGTYTGLGVGGSDVVAVVVPLVKYGSSSATATLGTMYATGNPSQTDPGNNLTNFGAGGVAGTDPTNWRTLRGPVSYVPAPTLGTGITIKVGKRTATTRVALVDLVGAYVEWVPATVDTGSGTVTASGSVTEAKTYTDMGSGTVALSGASTESKRYPDTATGTVTASGSATDGRSGANTGAGTVALSGTSAETKVYTETGAGTVSGSGTGSDAQIQTGSGAGTLTATATGADTLTRSGTAMGIVAASGIAVEAETHSAAVSGTVVLSGAAAESKTYTDTASGTVALSGATIEARRSTDSATGTIIVSGAATDSRSATDTGVGIVALAGSGSDAKTYTDAGSVAIVVSGSGTDIYTPPSSGSTYTDSGTGAIVLSGTQTDVLAHSATGTATFVVGGSGHDHRTLLDAIAGHIAINGAATDGYSYVDSVVGRVALSGIATDARVGADAGAAVLTIGGRATAYYSQPAGPGVAYTVETSHGEAHPETPKIGRYP